MNARGRFTIWVLTVGSLAFPFQALAQLVGTKDLSYPGYSAAPLTLLNYYKTADFAAELDSCQKAGRQLSIPHGDGVKLNTIPEKLRLEIVSLEPRVIHPGSGISVTIRISNDGESNVSLPWQDSAVETQSTDSNDSPRKTVDFATISVALNSRGKTFAVAGGVTLQARPSEQTHYVVLKPGEWVQVKFSASLQPDSGRSPVPSDRRATLTASWSDSTFAENRGECRFETDYFEGRRLHSKPFPVELIKPR